MEGMNQLLNERKGNPVKVGGAENHMQGLYFDLLSCLGGGDHPSLPPNYKMKPMTGFLDIVETFNDIAKLHPAGSGIVCEVESNEFVQDDKASSSEETLEATKSRANIDSLQSFLSQNDFYRGSSAESELLPAPLSSFIDSEYSKDQRENSPQEEIPISTNEQINVPTNENSEGVAFQDAQEELESNNYQDCQHLNGSKNTETHKSGKESHFDSQIVYANPHYIEEIGPPLMPPNSSASNPTYQQLGIMEEEMLKYSEELKEIERMLKERLVPPMEHHHRRNPTTLPSGSASRTNELQANLMPNNMVQTLADGLMSPTSALEMMYDMESNGSLCSFQTACASNYQSCTSFASSHNRASTSSFATTTPQTDSIRRTPSYYMDSLNLEKNGSSNYTHFTASLDSVKNPSSVSGEVSATSEHYAVENDKSVCEFRDSEDGNLLAEMVNKFTAKLDVNGNDVSYYSVNEESDVHEFADAEDSIKYKRKKKIRVVDKSSVSSDGEHVWSSPSGSDYEDVDDGSSRY